MDAHSVQQLSAKIQLREEAKRKDFHSGPIMWVSYASGYGLQVPIVVHVVSVEFHYPFKRHRVPHFLPNLTHFSRFPPIFDHIFLVFVLCTPVLAGLCFGVLY